MWNPLDGLATVNVSCKKLDLTAVIPTYGTPGAAGADLYALGSSKIEPGQRKLVPTGICIQLPEGFEAQVRPRSGLALKHGITCLNTPGTIDSDYRGEIQVMLINHGDKTFHFNKGDRIAQLVIVPVWKANFHELAELGDTQRGVNGFGSTGIQ